MLSGLSDELRARHGPAGMSAKLRAISRMCAGREEEKEAKEKAEEEVTVALPNSLRLETRPCDVRLLLQTRGDPRPLRA